MMKKRVVAFVLFVTMIFSIFSTVNITFAADFSGYTAVSTKEQLNNIRNNLSGKFYLTNDIIFSVVYESVY